MPPLPSSDRLCTIRPVYVETVARKGYRFIAPVTQVAEPIAAAPQRAARSRRRVALLAATVAVCAGAVIFAWVKFSRPPAESDSGSVHFTLAMPEGTRMAGAPYVPNMAVSPDGRTLALVAFATRHSLIHLAPPACFRDGAAFRRNRGSIATLLVSGRPGDRVLRRWPA